MRQRFSKNVDPQFLQDYARMLFWCTLDNWADALTFALAGLCVHEVYVDAAYPYDDGDGFSHETPFNSIHVAVNYATEFQAQNPLLIVRLNVSAGEYPGWVVLHEPLARVHFRGERTPAGNTILSGLRATSIGNRIRIFMEDIDMLGDATFPRLVR